MSLDKYIDVWTKVCDKFKQQQGDATYNSWIKPLEVSHFDSGVLYLNSPSKFIKNWVNNNYKNKINTHIASVDTSVYSIEIISDDKKSLQLVTSSNENITSDLPTENITKHDAEKKVEFSSWFNQKLNFNNYLVGDSNRMAHTVAVKASSGVFNPIIITGGVGRGKTHLMHAIANDMAEKDMHKNLVCLSSEKFMFLFIKALKQNSILDFKDFVRNADVLLVDDIQFLAGKQNVSEEFLHTYDSVIARGGMVIVTCAQHPCKYENLDERIKSRLSSGMVCEIDLPDRSLRYEILKSKFEKMNFSLSEDSINLLADKITGNIRDIDGVINRIIAQSFILNDAIDTEFLRRFFTNNSFYGEKKIITIEAVKRKIADHFNIKTTDLDSDRKTRQISKPRQVAMYLCKKLTNKGTSEIGRNFGNKDHSTVVNACRCTEEMIRSNEQFANVVLDIEKSFS